MKKALKVPQFKSEDRERNFWAKVSLADYLKAGDFVPASFSNLKPSSRSISIRLPQYLLIRIKEQANELNVPYQSLMKKYIAEGMMEESQRFFHRRPQKIH